MKKKPPGVDGNLLASETDFFFKTFSSFDTIISLISRNFWFGVKQLGPTTSAKIAVPRLGNDCKVLVC